jgi:protein-L-isoaspartate(D-aspartate) O-methyltransferase
LKPAPRTSILDGVKGPDGGTGNHAPSGDRGPRDPGGDKFAAVRARMVETQLRARGVRDPRVLAAMATVPREEFVPAGLGDLAYADEALPIEHEQTISQPLMVALMTELLAPEPGDRVLEVGTGSGYQAAVLATMGCRVTSVERIPELAATARERLARLGFGDRVEVRVGDGSATRLGSAGPGDSGEPGDAPWPLILVAAAAPHVPEALTDQLADGGRLVIPVGRRYEQVLVLVERNGAALRTSDHGACVFVPLIGEGGWR